MTRALDRGALGGDYGCWLTPTPYAACMAPYNLGLNTPRDVCVLIDVSDIVEVWGPGTIPPSNQYPDTWRGGGIEFYTPTPIRLAAVREVIELAPCGDTHVWRWMKRWRSSIAW